MKHSDYFSLYRNKMHDIKTPERGKENEGRFPEDIVCVCQKFTSFKYFRKHPFIHYLTRTHKNVMYLS